PTTGTTRPRTASSFSPPRRNEPASPPSPAPTTTSRSRTRWRRRSSSRSISTGTEPPLEFDGRGRLHLLDLRVTGEVDDGGYQPAPHCHHRDDHHDNGCQRHERPPLFCGVTTRTVSVSGSGS